MHNIDKDMSRMISVNHTRTDRPIFTQNTNQSASLNSCFFSNRSLNRDFEVRISIEKVMQLIESPTRFVFIFQY